MHEFSRVERLAYRVNKFCDATDPAQTKVYEQIAEHRLDSVRNGRCTIVAADRAKALLQSKPAPNAINGAKQSEAGRPVKEGGQDD
jgi:hypothetical protein